MKSRWLAVCVVAAVAFLRTTQVTADEPSKAPTPTADPMVGKEAGQERNDNGLEMKLVWCPPGRFTMGSPKSEFARGDNEYQTEVTLREGFWLGKYEVTQNEYQQITGKNPSYFSPQGEGSKKVLGQNTDRFPVECVSWVDATEFCRTLTDRERQAGRIPAGWEYTLPTEAEWEYGCRAGTTTAYSFGNQLNGQEANCDGSDPYLTRRKGPYLERTTTVGSYRGNKWGLYDMHGNVEEWCLDTYVFGESERVAPSVVPHSRVQRGGAWAYDAGSCRSAMRGHLRRDVSSHINGFRVALGSVRKAKAAGARSESSQTIDK